MATTSGTYDFASTANEQFIREAYERVGILPEVLTLEQIESAQRSANLILSEWINKKLNLWTVGQGLVNLVSDQNAYQLPTSVNKVEEAVYRYSTRQLGGTPYSSAGGTAANAFDGNSSTACTQDSTNGYISYNYGSSTYAIEMVGVQSNVTRTYTLIYEYSYDNVTWFPAYPPSASISPPSQEFVKGLSQWVVMPSPTVAQYFRIRETGGATLDIQELYFNITNYDIPITELSRSEYVYYSTKNQTGNPTSYYLDRQITPILHVWPTFSSTNTYYGIYYTYSRTMQDFGAQIDLSEIPQRFYDALCAGMAYRLALKFNPQKADMLKAVYDEAFALAGKEDAPKTPLRIYPNYMMGYARE